MFFAAKQNVCFNFIYINCKKFVFTWNIGKHFALYICWINITFRIVSVSVWIVSSIIMIEFCPPSSRVQSRKGLWGRGCREGWGNMNNAESLTVRLIILVWSSCTTVKAPCYCQVWQQFYIEPGVFIWHIQKKGLRRGPKIIN